MPIELLHPPLDRPSGGNVYDRCLLEAAHDAGVALSPVVVDFDDVERRFAEAAPAFRLWDGLLLERLARRGPLARGRWGVLLHWLASQDPALDAAARRRLEAIEDRIVEAASLVVVSGVGLQRALSGRHPRRRIALCEPGVRDAFLAATPAAPAAPAPASDVELLTVANLVPAKGLLQALPALASLRSLRWRWQVVGDRDVDPGHARRFDEEARRLALKHRIVQHGPLDAPAVVERMDRADLFVFPSRFESYGLVLAEAAARRLPVVGTRVGAAEHLFRDGIDSLLVPPGEPVAFREALRRAIEDATLRTRFRAALRTRPRPRDARDALAELLALVVEAGSVPSARRPRARAPERA